MDPALTALLFGSSDPGFDPDDPDERAAHLQSRNEDGDDLGMSGALDEVLATQMADGDPPAVAATARRLLAAGLPPAKVMAELRMALISAILDTVSPDDDDPVPDAPDPAGYEAALDRLPLPPAEGIEAAIVAAVRAAPRIGTDEAIAAAMDALGAAGGDRLLRSMAERVLDHLVEDEETLALLPGDRLVHLRDLLAGAVFTHRLTAEEIDLGVLDLSFDLAPLSALGDSHAAGVALQLDDVDAIFGWSGPPGWLDAYPAGTLVAVRLVAGRPDSDDGGPDDGGPDDGGLDDGGLGRDEVQIDGPVTVAGPDADIVAEVRAVYDALIDEALLPVEGEDLLLTILAGDPARWRTPQAPLEEICASAGLERRGPRVAHDEEVWAASRRAGRRIRVAGELDDDSEDTETVMAALQAIEDPDAAPSALRRHLRRIADPELLEVVTEELAAEETPAALTAAAEGCARAVAAASGTDDLAVAHWLSAVVAERRGEAQVASAHIDLGLQADDSHPLLIDRAAWYASDRGDAARALTLWRRLGPAGRAGADAVAAYARSREPRRGRNEPCWCGSGRKYKWCHQGQPTALPLAERVGWLCQKATWYLERRGAPARDDVVGLALARASAAGVEPGDDAIAEMLADPVIIDAALTEGGWWEQFVAERGPLLPDDEALMAQSWSMVERTLYEIVDTDPGAGMTLRDLRSAELVEVTERAFSTQGRPGQVVCARAVPVGDEGHQLVGAVFPVAAGTEGRLLDVLDRADPGELCRWVGAASRPPEMRTREGEVIVECRAVVAVPDPAAAAAWLDGAYQADEAPGGWSEMHPLSDDESILRARLELTGDRLQVETSSEERMDRVLAALTAGLPGATVLRDDRRPLAPGEMPAPPRGLRSPASLPGGAQLPPGALDDLQDTMERRWLDEPVPALGGLTPRQAADDPAARETLQRLLAEWPDPADLPPGAFGMRPQRLRQALGLAH